MAGCTGAQSRGLLQVALLLLVVPHHRRRFDHGSVVRATPTASGGGAAGRWNYSSSAGSAQDRLGSLQNLTADQKVDWQLAYKTTSAVATGSEQGWDADTIRAAWSSCNVHYAAIKYEIAGKVHSIYRRTHGPETHGVDAWKKGACDQCDGFDPVELITDCWVSKWKSGAPNAMTDFQMFSNEKDYFDRSAGLTPWKSCNFDDCGGKVGYPRDCGPAGAQAFDWHGFEGGNPQGKTDVAFYVSVCNGWTVPVIAFGDPTGISWGAIYTLVLLGLGYFVGGSALGARRKGEPLKKGAEMLQQHPHWRNWSQLHGLVQDGVGFSRARVNAKLGSARGGGYQPISKPRTNSEDGHAKRSSAKSKSKSKSKKGTDEVSKHSKDAKQSKQSTRGKRNKHEGGSTGQQTIEATEETAEEERARLLREERTAGVHSSQQAITVVGLNG